LLESDVNVKLVASLRTKVKAKVSFNLGENSSPINLTGVIGEEIVGGGRKGRGPGGEQEECRAKGKYYGTIMELWECADSVDRPYSTSW
jgi:hypothetical protein